MVEFEDATTMSMLRLDTKRVVQHTIHFGKKHNQRLFSNQIPLLQYSPCPPPPLLSPE